MPRAQQAATQDGSAMSRPGSDVASTRPDNDRIAQRAYERYDARGREDGHDQQDWFEAERELQQDAPRSTTRAAAGSSNSD